MKILTSVLIAFTLVFALTSCERAPQSPLEALRGQWVYINYWAQWCKPCLEEIPELSAFAKAHPNVAVRGVNYDGVSGEALAALTLQFGMDYPSLPEDPAVLLAKQRPSVLPVTWLLNPDGKVVNELLGPQTLVSLEATLALAKQRSQE